MCLTCLSSAKKRKEYIAEAQKRGYIRVYKVCKKKRTGWLYGRRYCQGLISAKGDPDRINQGFHACLSLQKARRLQAGTSYLPTHIITCYAKPQWVKGLSLRNKHASFTHLVFPEWKRGDMTIREFRQACKS